MQYEQSNYQTVLIKKYLEFQKGKKDILDPQEFQDLVNFFSDQNNDKKALQILDDAIYVYPLNTDLLLIKVDFLLDNEKAKEAEIILQQVERLDTSNPLFFVLKIEICLLNKDYITAQALQERFISVNQDNKDDLHYFYKLLLDVYEDYEMVKEQLFILYTLFDDNYYNFDNEILLDKIVMLSANFNKWDVSVGLLNNLSKKYPLDKFIWAFLGMGYLDLGLYENAIEAYKNAIALDDKYAYAYRGVSLAYFLLKDYTNAIKICEEVLLLNQRVKQNKSFLISIVKILIQCYVKLKNKEKTNLYIQSLKNFEDKNEEGLLYIVLFLYDLKQYHWVIDCGSIILKMDNKNADANYFVGKAYIKLNKHKEAIHFLSRAAFLDYTNEEYTDNYLQILVKNNAQKKALDFIINIEQIYNYYSNHLIFWKACFYYQLNKYEEGQKTLVNFFGDKKVKHIPQIIKKNFADACSNKAFFSCINLTSKKK